MDLISELGDHPSGKGWFYYPKSIAGYYTLDETGRVLMPMGISMISTLTVYLFDRSLTVKARGSMNG